ncbi:MAG: hypothetical protein AAF907_00075 [Planctomycetota bacterium]
MIAAATDRPSAGVLFSANDAVFDWSVGFLESFRAHNPDLPLAWIPFDDRVERLAGLAPRYGFTAFEDDSFARLEAIGRSLELGHSPYGPHWFRRFAAFWGPFERFLYLDCRQLVLCDLTEFLHGPAEYGFDLLHFDCTLDQVYESGELRRSFLRKGRGRGFNSGRWASRRGLFDLETLERRGAECVAVRDQLNPRNTDQFFLNYCCDTGTVPTGDGTNEAPAERPIRPGHFAEVMGDLCQSAWARQSGRVFRDEKGVYRRWDHGGEDHAKRAPILHWAGIGLSPAMPEAQLFYRYRNKAESAGTRATARLRHGLIRPAWRWADRARRQRQLNGLWHRLKGDGG